MDKNINETQEQCTIHSVVSSALLMPCGSDASCEYCTHAYMRSCSWINRMTDEEYEKHKEVVKAAI